VVYCDGTLVVHASVDFPSSVASIAASWVTGGSDRNYSWA
jgi:hypothetical protein